VIRGCIALILVSVVLSNSYAIHGDVQLIVLRKAHMQNVEKQQVEIQNVDLQKVDSTKKLTTTEG
jgi:hypothetical protein